MATSIASIVSIHSEWKVNLNLARVYVKIMTLVMCFRHIKIIKYSQEKKLCRFDLLLTHTEHPYLKNTPT